MTVSCWDRSNDHAFKLFPSDFQFPRDCMIRLQQSWYKNGSSTMFSSKKVVPGSEIWTPQSPILNAVGKQSVDYDSRIFRIDSNGTVSAEIDLFAAGYCLIFPKYYPKDQHICLFPLALRTGLFQSICLLLVNWIFWNLDKDLNEIYNLTEVRYGFITNTMHPQWDIVGSMVIMPYPYDNLFKPDPYYPGFSIKQPSKIGKSIFWNLK